MRPVRMISFPYDFLVFTKTRFCQQKVSAHLLEQFCIYVFSMTYKRFVRFSHNRLSFVQAFYEAKFDVG